MIIEGCKDFRYGKSLVWPEDQRYGFSKSIWNQFPHTMSMRYPMYELRNWFSQSSGVKKGSLEDQRKSFADLVRYCEDFLPVVKELVRKLGAALEDEDAWPEQYVVRARKEEQPEYKGL
jgi:hypothetical protein